MPGKNDKSKEIDFIGIGSAKCGTSWLGECLEEHPDVNMSKWKSLFFFNADYGNQYIKDNWTNFDKGIDWYLDQFLPVEEGKVRGEYGVSYLQDEVALKRIKKYFPKTKILVSLRNPVDMLYSLFWYAKNTVEIDITDSFEEAVEQKIYMDRGNYFKHLSKYFKEFPKENIHVMIFEDIKSTPEKVTKELFEFLGVDPSFRPSILDKKVYSSSGFRFKFIKNFGFKFMNLLNSIGLSKVRLFILNNPIFYSIYSAVNVVPKKYPKMDPEIRKKLIKYYEPDIKKLEKLIGRDLSIWRE